MKKLTNSEILKYWDTGRAYVELYVQWEKVHKRSYSEEINKALRMMYALECAWEMK